MRGALWCLFVSSVCCLGCSKKVNELVYVHDSLPDTIKVRVDVDSAKVRVFENGSGDISIFPEKEQSGDGYRRVTGCEVFDETHWKCWNDYQDLDGVGENDSNRFRIYGEGEKFRQEFMFMRDGKYVTKEATYTLRR